MAVLPDTASVAESTLTCVDTTSSDTTTKTEPQPTNADPSTTPLRMPTELLSSPSFNPFYARPVPESPPLDEELALTMSLMDACCRMHEASNMVTALCNRFIHQWSGGMSPEEAAVAASIAIQRKFKHVQTTKTVWGVETKTRGTPMELVIAQTMLSMLQLNVAMAGAAAGKLMDARNKTVSRGYLHPLPASHRGSGDDTPTALTTTASTFAAFTDGFTLETNVDHLTEANTKLSDNETVILVYGSEIIERWGGTGSTLRSMLAFWSKFRPGRIQRACEQMLKDIANTGQNNANDSTSRSTVANMRECLFECSTSLEEAILGTNNLLSQLLIMIQPESTKPSEKSSENTRFGFHLLRSKPAKPEPQPECVHVPSSDEILVAKVMRLCLKVTTVVLDFKKRAKTWREKERLESKGSMGQETSRTFGW